MTGAIGEPEVITRIEGRVGRITLNRPQALHALTTRMCRDITAALLAWREDPTVELVLLDHSGERGFCAGGDIRMLAESGAGDGQAAREFFFVEYRLNDLLFRYPKPTVAIMDGVTMGGGVGLSRPCRFRVATERTTFAMPETGIGLFPDVGGGWYLSRMPDHIGLWLALTGARIKAADCELLGLATDYVESARVAELKAGIVADPGGAETLLTELEGDAGRPPIAAHQDEIARLFAHDSVEAIVAALKGAGTDWAAEQLKIMGNHGDQVASDDEGRVPPAPARREGGDLRREHGHGVPDRRARRATARLHRGRARGDCREGQCAEVGSRCAGGRHRAHAGRDLRPAAGRPGVVAAAVKAAV